MTFKELVRHHKIFVTFLVLFFVVGAVDMYNLDRLMYKAMCDWASPVSGSPCPPFYDIPIWEVYLSLGILAGLYHVHDELRTHTKHLSSRK